MLFWSNNPIIAISPIQQDFQHPIFQPLFTLCISIEYDRFYEIYVVKYQLVTDFELNDKHVLFTDNARVHRAAD